MLDKGKGGFWERWAMGKAINGVVKVDNTKGKGGQRESQNVHLCLSFLQSCGKKGDQWERRSMVKVEGKGGQREMLNLLDTVNDAKPRLQDY